MQGELALDLGVGERDTAARTADLPPLHAGIAWGPALPRAGDWIDRTVNLASRIAAVAPRDTILVDEAMYSRLDAAVVACEPAGNFALKGYDKAAVRRDRAAPTAPARNRRRTSNRFSGSRSATRGLVGAG
jgi:class 3 adenylate cyclase